MKLVLPNVSVGFIVPVGGLGKLASGRSDLARLAVIGQLDLLIVGLHVVDDLMDVIVGPLGLVPVESLDDFLPKIDLVVSLTGQLS